MSKNLSRFGLASFALRDTSLEEVFFKICESAGNLKPSSNRRSNYQETEIVEASAMRHNDENEHLAENSFNNGESGERTRPSSENLPEFAETPSGDENNGDDDHSFRIDDPSAKMMSSNLPDVVISQVHIAFTGP